HDPGAVLQVVDPEQMPGGEVDSHVGGAEGVRVAERLQAEALLDQDDGRRVSVGVIFAEVSAHRVEEYLDALDHLLGHAILVRVHPGVVARLHALLEQLMSPGALERIVAVLTLQTLGQAHRAGAVGPLIEAAGADGAVLALGVFWQRGHGRLLSLDDRPDAIPGHRLPASGVESLDQPPEALPGAWLQPTRFLGAPLVERNVVGREPQPRDVELLAHPLVSALMAARNGARCSGFSSPMRRTPYSFITAWTSFGPPSSRAFLVASAWISWTSGTGASSSVMSRLMSASSSPALGVGSSAM